MTLPLIGKHSSWPAVAPLLAGTSFDLTHFSRGEFVAAGAFLLTGIVAAAAAQFRSQRKRSVGERKSTAEKMPISLVALSSAAVLAVYAAGYWRTRGAEELYLQQSAMRRAAAVAHLIVTAPPAPPPSASAPAISTAQISPNATPPHNKKRSPQSSKQILEAGNHAPLPPQGSTSSTDPPGLPVGISTDDPTLLAGNPLPKNNSTPPAPETTYKDGSYLGWGSSRHGDIQASVVIRQGHIVSATIAQCWTRYPCTWIAPLPGQVVSRQSADVDNISGATESSDAFFAAITEALMKAIKAK